MQIIILYSNYNSILLTAIKSTSYRIFLSNGTQINFSICNGMEINVEKPINTSLIEIYKESLELLNKYNLSIFDDKNEAFNDICIPLELDGKDLSIYTRQNKLKSKINLCDNGCNFIDFDYERNYSLCECKIMDEQNKMGFGDFLKDNIDIINKTINLKENSNIIIFKCLARTKFDYKNYIFYIALFLNIGHFISLSLFILYFIKIKKNKIKNKINNIKDKKKNQNKKNSEDNFESISSKRTILENSNTINNKNNLNKTIDYKYKENGNGLVIDNENNISNIEKDKEGSNQIKEIIVFPI